MVFGPSPWILSSSSSAGRYFWSSSVCCVSVPSRKISWMLAAIPLPIPGISRSLLEIPGIGKGMAANIQEIFREGTLTQHTELLQKYRPAMLELLKIQGLGPKTIALIWDAYQICDLEGVEKLAREGKLRELPRMGEKHEQKILKGIEEYRRISGRYHLDEGDNVANRLIEFLAEIPGVEKITP